MQHIKSGFISILLLTTCWALLTHSTMAAVMPAAANANEAYADAFDDPKNADAQMTMQKRPSFFVGSRYGRSSAQKNSFYAPSKTRRLSVMPRNDRFFLGSRYGKRSGEGEFMSPYEQGLVSELANVALNTNTNNNNHNNNNIGNGSGSGSGSSSAPPYLMMTCIHTGHRNLYRCNSVEEINGIINELTAAGRHGFELENDVDDSVGVGAIPADDNINNINNNNNHGSN